MFFKNKLERLLERICVIVLCVITAVMAIPVKSVTAAGSASVVLEILHEGDTVNVKLEMVSNPGIAGMSFKLCYDSSLLSIVSVDETLDSFKSSIINPDGAGFVGYAYAQAKDCKDTGTVFSIAFKINRENEKELTYESVYIDEFDACRIRCRCPLTARINAPFCRYISHIACLRIYIIHSDAYSSKCNIFALCIL